MSDFRASLIRFLDLADAADHVQLTVEEMADRIIGLQGAAPMIAPDPAIKIVKKAEWGDGTFTGMGFDEDDRIEAGDDVRITVLVEVTE